MKCNGKKLALIREGGAASYQLHLVLGQQTNVACYCKFWLAHCLQVPGLLGTPDAVPQPVLSIHCFDPDDLWVRTTGCA